MSYSISLNGLKNAQTELDTISNNLANAETTGFKRSTVNFSDLVAGSAYTNPKLIHGIGSSVAAISQDFATGSMASTGSALDMAVNGEGFFTVKSPITGSVLYTRNGNFSADSSGNVADQNGNRVQMLAYNSTTGVYGPGISDLNLPPTKTTTSNGVTTTSAYAGVQIKSDGSIVAAYADGSTTTVGKVALASFVSTSGLLSVGNQDWQATGLSGGANYYQPTANGMGEIKSGQLEQSNVDMATEMVGLITSLRFFQANSKAIDTATQISDAVINLRS
jgi:flagellar hook protein FlgE